MAYSEGGRLCYLNEANLAHAASEFHSSWPPLRESTSSASSPRVSWQDVLRDYAFADLSAIMHGGLLLPVVGRHAYGRLLCACKWNRWTAEAAALRTHGCYMLDGWSGPDLDGNDSQA